jgi:voltage-gated potassium channel Kch
LSKEYDTILFGYNRIGFDVLRALKKIKGKYLIVDFNPDTIANLKKLKMPALYGDAYDSDLLSELSLDKVSLIVSTIPDSETNALLVDMVRAVNKKAIIIVKARQINDALDLYRRGANYVLTAHFLGGEHLSKMISKLKVDKGEYGKERRKHIKDLTDRLRSLHKNPFKYHKGEE